MQSRRKADLYETVTHYAGDGLDPAKTDPSLAAKLNENLKNHKKISDILEKFARKQDMPEEEEEEEKADKSTTNSREEESTPSATNIITDTKEIITQTTNLNSVVVNEKEVVVKPEENKPETDKTKNEIVIEDIAEDEYDEEEEDEEDDEDDEDEVNLDEQVETLANGDVSDNESDTEIMSPKEIFNSTKEASGHNKTIENVLNEKNNTLENTVISLNSSSESSINIKNCMDKENNSAIIQINSESNDSIYVNNNNLDISTTTTKTVINTPITIDKDKSLIPSSSPPPTLLNPLATTPNGKLKDMPLHQLLNSNNSTITTTTTPELIVYPNVNATITATTTTKTTADLKIVHVSSLEPDNDGDDDDVLLSDSKRNKDVTNLCAELIAASSASKSLEEIVISDEES